MVKNLNEASKQETQSFFDYRCDESNDRYLFVRKISYAEEYQRVCVYKKANNNFLNV